MSARDVMKVNGSNTPEEDTMLTQSYIQEQSELFEKMKKFLISQQSTLRHNLEDAREKIDKTGIQQKAGQKEGTLPQPSTSHGTQIDDVGRIQPKQSFNFLYFSDLQALKVNEIFL